MQVIRSNTSEPTVITTQPFDIRTAKSKYLRTQRSDLASSTFTITNYAAGDVFVLEYLHDAADEDMTFGNLIGAGPQVIRCINSERYFFTLIARTNAIIEVQFQSTNREAQLGFPAAERGLSTIPSLPTDSKTLFGAINEIYDNIVPIGMLMPWPLGLPQLPDKFLNAENQTLLNAEVIYPKLFAKVEASILAGLVTVGGFGWQITGVAPNRNLKLPDARGLTFRALNQGSGLDPDGAARLAASIQDYAIRQHQHSVTHNANTGVDSSPAGGGNAGDNTPATITIGNVTGAGVLISSNEVRMKNFGGYWVVRVK